MKKRKPVECYNCGCARKILIKAKVREQKSNGDYIEGEFKRMCFPCLMRSVNMSNAFEKGTYDYKFAMECVE